MCISSPPNVIINAFLAMLVASSDPSLDRVVDHGAGVTNTGRWHIQRVIDLHVYELLQMRLTDRPLMVRCPFFL